MYRFARIKEEKEKCDERRSLLILKRVQDRVNVEAA
jgi:hypothetical protein